MAGLTYPPNQYGLMTRAKKTRKVSLNKAGYETFISGNGPVLMGGAPLVSGHDDWPFPKKSSEKRLMGLFFQTKGTGPPWHHKKNKHFFCTFNK